MPFEAPWMDLEIIILSEVNQTNIIWYCLYAESKKMIQMSLFTKPEHTEWTYDQGERVDEEG